MPNLWMHIEYGRQLKNDLQSFFPFGGGSSEHALLYQLGCQGPDLLYYHSFLPWSRDIGAARLSDLLHSQSCGGVLMAFWNKILRLPLQERGPAAAYFTGFLTHHLLDRGLHPYINWKSGYKHRDHQRFEVALDTVFIKHLNGRNTWKIPGWKEIDAGPALPASIVDILHETACTFYPEAANFPKSGWQQAYRDMVKAQKLLYDPHGWKKKLIYGPNSALFYRKLTAAEEKLDFLNERNAPWRHSALYSEVRTDSVPQLWEQALVEGRTVIKALAAWMLADSRKEAEVMRERFRLTLGDRSYDTGKDCGSNLVNQYAEPIWETAAVN
ncbi:zinc dependent phospholipase C family protein [Paenibacillus durus]|uniref:Phospholipase C/D domain-containing protein n=1 Tax=Paenibacillus durus ATCC 35681 TaxID=1333534 RepID=A0A0F7F9P7_PAEDU|nr:zinc dependent phospholipase C family protein [Paenibacillus durus]AKG35139.1 hypothetical protein VK70_11655 [Paenibacillus durus ATCC 35681]